MEDQQVAPDDLTATHSDDGAATDSAVGRGEIDSAADASGACRSRSWLDAWLPRAVVALAALFVISAAFAGAVTLPYLTDRSASDNRIALARTAVAAVTTLWTYTPDTIAGLPDRADEFLAGDFRAQYRRFLEAAVAPSKQAQVTDKTEVVGVAVEALKGSDARVLILTNTTATSPLTKNIPSLKYVAYRLVMTRRGSRWLVTAMETVSFLDLTPRL